jgi:hypothetical protein
LDEALKGIKDNKEWDDARKEIESEPLRRKKAELQEKVRGVYGKEEPKEEGDTKKKEPPLSKEDKAKIDDVLKKDDDIKDSDAVDAKIPENINENADTATEKVKSDTDVPPEEVNPIETTNTQLNEARTAVISSTDITPPDGTKKLKIGERALQSEILPDDVKQEISEKGIEYVPRGRKITDREAEEIVRLFDGDEGGLDKIANMVYDKENGILPDTRVSLNALIIEKYANRLEGITEANERAIERDKLTNAVIFAAEQGKLAGEEVEANKRIARVLRSTPETIVASVREKHDRRNKEFFTDKKIEVNYVKQVIDEYIKSGDFKKKIETEVNEEISKIGTKNWGKESKKKIDDFFDSLLIDPKQQNLYGGMLGIPVALYNGSILAVKNALLLGVDVATAVQRGAEWLDKEFKDQYEKGKIDSPEWSRDEYLADTKQRLSGLNKVVPKVETPKVKPAKVKKPTAPKTREEIVDKLLERMAKVATRKQLSNFVMKYLQELSDKGAISDPRFRAILADALGRDYMSEKTEAKITDAARKIGYAGAKTEELANAFEKYLGEFNNDPKSASLPDLKAAIEKARKEVTRAQRQAQIAHQQITEALTESPDLVARLGTMIQGGLLVPGSQVANVLGNALLLPITGPAYLISGMVDASVTGTAWFLNGIRAKVKPVEHPDLYRILNRLPDMGRTVKPLTYAKGYFKGVGPAVKEGIIQLKTGALGRDMNKAESQRGIHPIESLKDIPKAFKNKEFQRLVGDVLEALPAGYFAEANFRLLNLGDKPFRGGAEGGRYEELFEIDFRNKLERAEDITDPAERAKRIDYLKKNKDILLRQFKSHPDTEVLKEARQQGDVATFSQATTLSRWLTGIEGFISKKDSKTASTIGSAILRLIKITNLPYVKVPINLTSTAVELGIPPISLVKFIYHASKGDRRSAMDDMGKLIMSSAVTAAVMSLAANGLITTKDEDKDVQAAQREAGVEEGRINITATRRWLAGGDPTWQDGDKTWSVKRLGVLSVLMMSVAQAYKNLTPEEMADLQNSDFVMRLAKTDVEMIPHVPGVALQQSIMTGTNTLLQGMLGGEAEKDRWLTNQATVLSTVLYPNTIATISQSADPERFFRETRDLSMEEGRIKKHLENIYKDRVFQGDKLPPKVTIWGEPIRRIPEGSTMLYNILGVTKTKEYQKYSFGTRMYELYEEYSAQDPENAPKIFPSMPSSATKVGWDDSRMSPDDLATYQMRVGQVRAEDAEAYLNSNEWEDATLEEKITELTSIYNGARKQAEAEMFSWMGYQKRDPQGWGVLMENDALPMPSMSRKAGDFKLDADDIRQLNETALELYAQQAISLLSQMSKADLETMKNAIDEKTGKSDYVTELNRIWRGALSDAKNIMEETLAKKQVNK